VRRVAEEVEEQAAAGGAGEAPRTAGARKASTSSAKRSLTVISYFLL
jgi:hypothetical protein